MSGSCAVCVDQVVYLFGGHHARGNTNKVSNSKMNYIVTLHQWIMFNPILYWMQAGEFWARYKLIQSRKIPPHTLQQVSSGQIDGVSRISVTVNISVQEVAESSTASPTGYLHLPFFAWNTQINSFLTSVSSSNWSNPSNVLFHLPKNLLADKK